jgi:hypothetical protein
MDFGQQQPSSADLAMASSVGAPAPPQQQQQQYYAAHYGGHPQPPAASPPQLPPSNNLAVFMPRGNEWTKLFVLAAIVFALSHRQVQKPILKAFPAWSENEEIRAGAVAVAAAAAFHIAYIKMMI